MSPVTIGSSTDAKKRLLRVAMYGHTYSKSKDQPGKVTNSACGQLNREK